MEKTATLEVFGFLVHIFLPALSFIFIALEYIIPHFVLCTKFSARLCPVGPILNILYFHRCYFIHPDVFLKIHLRYFRAQIFAVVIVCFPYAFLYLTE